MVKIRRYVGFNNSIGQADSNHLGPIAVCRMCGIAFHALACPLDQSQTISPLQAVANALRARGPDGCRSHKCGCDGWDMTFTVSVLHMQGLEQCVQPIISEHGDVFGWNGEVFGGLPIQGGESDTIAVHSLLQSALGSVSSPEEAASAARSALCDILGPFAFLYWHAATATLLYGRDRVGRRSLSYLTSGDATSTTPLAVCISSVGPVDLDWEAVEIEPTGVHAMVFRQGVAPVHLHAQWTPSLPFHVNALVQLPLPLGKGDGVLPANEACMNLCGLALLRSLSASVRTRVQLIAPHLRQPESADVGSHTVFTHEKCPNTVMKALAGMGLSLTPASSDCDGTRTAIPCDLAASLPNNAVWAAKLHLGADREVRQDGGVLRQERKDSGALIAVLFSGGLDSMVIARLAHEHLPLHETIDLINVCFSADRRSPDRMAAWHGLAVLKALCPGRPWQLICVDDSLEDALCPLRCDRTLRLLRPRGSVMDFNIGSALWSAAQGVGFVDVDVASNSLTSVVGAPPYSHSLYAFASGVDSVDCQAGLPSLRYCVDTTATTVAESATQSAHNNSDFNLATPVAAPFDVLAVQSAIAGGEATQGLREVIKEHCRLVLAANEAIIGDASKEVRADSAVTQSDDTEVNDARADVGAIRDEWQRKAPCCSMWKGRPCLAISASKCSRGMCRLCCTRASCAEGAAETVAPCPWHVPKRVAKSADVDASESATNKESPSPTVTSHVDSTRVRVLVRSSARVILSGIGADEYMAGYGRHRTAFKDKGWSGLRSELDLDVSRLWSRNLGRDDRVCSDSGRELRQPFLAEEVASTLAAIPLPLIADLRLPHGAGDKRILRTVGRQLGLHAASTLVKRAIHFGSRIAQASNTVAFGSNKKANRAHGGVASVLPALQARGLALGICFADGEHVTNDQ